MIPLFSDFKFIMNLNFIMNLTFIEKFYSRHLAIFSVFLGILVKSFTWKNMNKIKLSLENFEGLFYFIHVSTGKTPDKYTKK